MECVILMYTRIPRSCACESWCRSALSGGACRRSSPAAPPTAQSRASCAQAQHVAASCRPTYTLRYPDRKQSLPSDRACHVDRVMKYSKSDYTDCAGCGSVSAVVHSGASPSSVASSARGGRCADSRASRTPPPPVSPPRSAPPGTQSDRTCTPV